MNDVAGGDDVAKRQVTDRQVTRGGRRVVQREGGRGLGAGGQTGGPLFANSSGRRTCHIPRCTHIYNIQHHYTEHSIVKAGQRSMLILEDGGDSQ